MSNSVWILTSEYNDYDQHGEYFEAVFFDKPTAEELEKYGVIDDEHALNGGNVRIRTDMEDHMGNTLYKWFYLEEHKE